MRFLFWNYEKRWFHAYMDMGNGKSRQQQSKQHQTGKQQKQQQQKIHTCIYFIKYTSRFYLKVDCLRVYTMDMRCSFSIRSVSADFVLLPLPPLSAYMLIFIFIHIYMYRHRCRLPVDAYWIFNLEKFNFRIYLIQ